MVKNHSDSERGNPLPPHGLFFLFSSKGSFYMHHHTDWITHTTTFVTPVVVYGVGHMVKDHSVRDQTYCHHYMAYSF